jgi:hypothetical protein
MVKRDQKHRFPARDPNQTLIERITTAANISETTITTNQIMQRAPVPCQVIGLDDISITKLTEPSDSHEKLSTGRLSAETEPFDSSAFGDIVGRLRLWADGLDVNEGRLDKALERSTVVKTALFTVFISMTTLLTKGSISQ